jgi:hypothetical protein
MQKPSSPRTLIACAAALLLGACSERSNSQEFPNSCRSSCEGNDWPRAIVGIIPPVGFSGDETSLLRLRAQSDAGTVYTPTPHGCPKTTNLVCSFSVSTAPRDVTLEFTAELPDGRVLSWPVALMQHNYCAQQIAYSTVTLEQNAAPQLSTVRYVSPCSNLENQ